MDELKSGILILNKSRYIVSSILIILILNCVLIVSESDFSRVNKFVVNTLMLFTLIVSHSRMVKAKGLIRKFDFFLPEVRLGKLKRLELLTFCYFFIEFLLLFLLLVMIATKDAGGVLDSSNMVFVIFAIIGILNLESIQNHDDIKEYTEFVEGGAVIEEQKGDTSVSLKK